MSRIRVGMIGGGQGAFIGAVHRRAMALDGEFGLVAGAFSADPDRARASGRELGLDERRVYSSWNAMLNRELELTPEERVQAVVIVTPNHTHFEIAHAFAAAGFHIICDKPLCTTFEEARSLIATAQKTGIVFGVMYNYSGYPLVRQARHMVRSGAIGELRKVTVEYHQGWLSSALEKQGQKQAQWRCDPARAGIGGAIGDIGSHAEHLARYITGLELESLCADLTSFVAGRELDDDASVLMRFAGGARGVLIASQIETGVENDLRIRIAGTEGTLIWRQEQPNELVHLVDGGPERVLRRGQGYLCPEARAATRLPPGHPEGFAGAFANVYRDIAATIRVRNGVGGGGSGGGSGGEAAAPPEFPTVYDGARGVWFIERTVESGRGGAKWTDARWPL
jgi:predicted dehydrogenase